MQQHRSRSDDLTTGPPRFYSVAEVAQILGMSAMTVYRAISAGELPAMRIRGRVIVPAKALDVMTDAALSGALPDGSDGTVGGPA